MKLLIISGITNNPKYQLFEEEIENCVVNNKDYDIDYFRLRDMNINYCTGCWNCWVKTPGKCAIKDDHEQILSRLPNSDKILYISPIIMGYESALLKTFKDRIIPTAHPYIKVYKGEQHHHQRYEHMPEINVLLLKDEDTIIDDLHLIKHTYERVALNFSSSLNQFQAIDEIGGVQDVLSRI